MMVLNNIIYFYFLLQQIYCNSFFVWSRWPLVDMVHHEIISMFTYILGFAVPIYHMKWKYIIFIANNINHDDLDSKSFTKDFSATTDFILLQQTKFSFTCCIFLNIFLGTISKLIDTLICLTRKLIRMN